MSPKIAQPLTLRPNPSDYATFNQIKSFLIFITSLLIEREKTTEKALCAFTSEQGWISAKFGKSC